MENQGSPGTLQGCAASSRNREQNKPMEMNGYRRRGTQTERNTTQAQKKDEPVPFIATQMDLEIITSSEVSHKEKDKYHMNIYTILFSPGGAKEPKTVRFQFEVLLKI